MPKRNLDQKPSKVELDRQPDDALKQTFPASDPITVGVPTAFIPDRPVDRQAPMTDTELVNELAANTQRPAARRNKIAVDGSGTSAPPSSRLEGLPRCCRCQPEGEVPARDSRRPFLGAPRAPVFARPGCEPRRPGSGHSRQQLRRPTS